MIFKWQYFYLVNWIVDLKFIWVSCNFRHYCHYHRLGTECSFPILLDNVFSFIYFLSFFFPIQNLFTILTPSYLFILLKGFIPPHLKKLSFIGLIHIIHYFKPFINSFNSIFFFVTFSLSPITQHLIKVQRNFFSYSFLASLIPSINLSSILSSLLKISFQIYYCDYTLFFSFSSYIFHYSQSKYSFNSVVFSNLYFKSIIYLSSLDLLFWFILPNFL